MRIFKLLFNSFILGIVISVLAFQSEWLEMRMNIGYFIPMTMLLALLGYFILNKKYPQVYSNSYVVTIANILISSVICLAVLGFGRFMIVPAAIIRELLFLTKVSFDIINMGLIALFIAGVIIIFLSDFKHRRLQR